MLRDIKLTSETGRFLALWMSYEDLIRVADLKSRFSRFERVRAEVQANRTSRFTSSSTSSRASRKPRPCCRRCSRNGCSPGPESADSRTN